MRRPGDLITKDPQATEPQGFDWTTYLEELGTGVLIQTSTWTITGPDALLTYSDASVLTGSLKTQAFLAAGTLGYTYTVTNRITTNSSPVVTDDRSFDVLIGQK